MTVLGDTSVSKLITFLKEKPRVTRHGNREYIDAGNNLELICLPRHAVVFGRRGSGKTMLLSELGSKAKAGTQGVVWIDVDDYKTLTFPDILIQILRSLLGVLSQDVRRQNPWYRPLKYLGTRALRSRLAKEEKFLSDMLQRFEEADMRVDEQLARKDVRNRKANLQAEKVVSAELGESRASEQTHSRSESSAGRDRKIDRISRHLHDAKALLRDVTAAAYGTYYLVLDDFYHLTISDQAQVLDYLQSLTKNLNVYIKFGTIAHRSNLYRRGETLIHGMQKEHDVLPIDLDRTFQNFAEVEKFVSDLWRQIKQVDEQGSFDELFGGESWKQLVLASGGVPRDFMNILARALDIGRSRQKKKLDVFLINEAANLYLRETKHDDLISDSAQESGELEQMLLDIRNFCVDNRKRNLFLADKDELEAKQHQLEMLCQLLDYRFIHLVHSNTSAAGKKGRYVAYMLDVGLYAHPQRRDPNRVKQVDFLSRDDRHRADAIRTQPVYALKDDYVPNGGSPFDELEELRESGEAETSDSAAISEVDESGQRLLPF